MVPGETVGKRMTKCSDCRIRLKVEVLRSNTGFYLGFFCDNCGPYSRESNYYRTREEAQSALDSGEYERYE